MSTFPGTLFRWATAVAVVAVTLSGCGRSAGTATPAGAPAPVRQALQLVPASVTQVEFADQAAAKKRWGLADLTGSAFIDKSQAAKRKEFIQHSMQSASGVELLTYAAMMDDWGWNAMDVDWEVRYFRANQPPVTINKLRDGLDMTVVTKSFTDHGFRQTGSGDELRFDGNLSNAGARAFLRGVTVIPSRHLLIMARPEGAKLPAADSSLGSNDTAEQLTAGMNPIDYVALSVGPDACLDPVAALGRSVSPEQAKEAAAKLGTFGTIGGAAAAVIDDEKALVRTIYADDAAAAADLAARQKLMTDGRSLVSQERYSKIFPGSVTADGKFLQYDLTPAKSAQIMQSVHRLDTPWAWCA
jgi:hypothetical protein